ncbi:MAG: DUF5686 family protein [Bacteroidetes bacterium]|nr:DUF5686 family protein [Bacteroidota bacterium]
MNRIHLIFLFALLLTPLAVNGQVVVRGTILDARDGRPLPHATIQLEGTIRGTVANTSGQFLMTIPALPARLEVRFIGYRSQIVSVTRDNVAALEIALEAVAVNLGEVVVSGENPAEGIVRNAIAAKQRMRRHLRATYADTYTRFLLYSDFDLVQMNESVRGSWWTPEGGSREVIRAERSEPARSGLFRFAGPHPVPDLLDDTIEVLGASYAGPLHPNALEFYDFTMGPSREFDDQRVIDIYFSPKSTTRPTFSGYMAVLDSTFAVVQVNARPWPSTDITPPVKLHEVYMEQRFFEVGDSLWLPRSLFVQGTVEFGRAGATYPTARYEQVSGMSLHAVNPPVPDSLAIKGSPVVVDPLARFNGDLFLRNPSYIPATPREAEQIATMDPTMRLERAFRPEGLLANYTAVDVTEEAEEDLSPKGRLRLVNRITGGDWFWYNRVDGWQPGLGYGGGIGDGGKWRVSGGYSVERARPSYKAEVSIPWAVGPINGYLGLFSSDATSVVAREEGLGRFVPGMATYFGWDDIYDYYDLRKQRVSLDLVHPRLPMLLSTSINLERHRSLEKLSDFNGWLFRNVQRENPAIDDGDLRSLEVQTRLGDRKKISLDVLFERSPGAWLNSDFDFRRWEARGTARLTTFYRNRSRPNWLRITTIAGTSHGSLPVQRQFSLSGSAGPFSNFAGFRTLSNGRFLADELLGVFWTHDFTTSLFEKLGLWVFADKGWGIHVFGGHAFSSDPDLGTFGGLHHEAGIGLSYPFGLPFRIDVAHGTGGGTYLRFGRPLY